MTAERAPRTTLTTDNARPGDPFLDLLEDIPLLLAVAEAAVAYLAAWDDDGGNDPDLFERWDTTTDKTMSALRAALAPLLEPDAPAPAPAGSVVMAPTPAASGEARCGHWNADAIDYPRCGVLESAHEAHDPPLGHPFTRGSDR